MVLYGFHLVYTALRQRRIFQRHFPMCLKGSVAVNSQDKKERQRAEIRMETALTLTEGTFKNNIRN